ncbi:NADH:ubiquinone reductase (Na(+)-transporting) subunit B [Putridiphycobacter roseus]|uniref:Na(+)-translocating NADH-quinone reductase subunit B n=1 Tax=Putridiphycobacter roseus TaxID=2219161 RepID=A0A2W1NKQ9_9FLAO|nr:NADH:ubiquinone reductase (Na(+)-transporting) subunit B [Putridiphycobacter roseus]PZE18446.1 NADH:ubiquinone reductase (Na(+)-transporting) subunit B [Putridiphycobacter roseus]
MNSIEKLMRKFEPDHDGKWAKFHPVWDGFFTILFTPGETTQKGAHIRDGVDLKRTMMMVIIALIPCLLFGIYNTGHWHYIATGETTAYMDMFGAKVGYGLMKVLPLVIVSYGVGLGVEFIFAIKNQHSIQEGFLVSGMLIPLIVPADVPLWMLAIAVIFAVVIGKEVFGGTGMNIINVALTARAFLFFGYPTKMSGNDVWMSGISDVAKRPDGYTGATPLGDLASFASDEWVYESVDKFSDKWSLMDSIFGFIPGSVGETSMIAIGIGALILLGTGIASWRIMLSFVIGGLAMGYLFNATAVNPFMELNPIHQIALGGFAFGAVFMITDPVTAAQTNTGKYIYGFLAGFFAILVRVFNPAFPEGVMMAILFFNILAPLIDHYVVQANIKRRLKRLKTKTA